jgi:hypothetical protein
MCVFLIVNILRTIIRLGHVILDTINVRLHF